MKILNKIIYYIDPINRIITISNILLEFRGYLLSENLNQFNLS